MLSQKDILFIMDRIGEETVVEPSKEFPYRVSRARSMGYSKDQQVAALQAKLSIMLEVAAKAASR